MDTQRLGPGPGVLNEYIRGDIFHLPDDIQFAESVEATLLIGNGVEFHTVAVMTRANGVKPMIDKSVAVSVHGGSNSPAAIMTDNEDMPHLEDLHGELQH